MVSYNSVLDFQFNDTVIDEPVTLTEVKNFCKIDIGTDDDLLIALITAARQQCEAFTGVGFVEHSAVAIIDNCNGGIYLPYGPTGAINQVTNWQGTVLVLDSTYTLSGNEFKRMLTPKENDITVDYTTGYTTLPESMKTALLNQIYYLYDNRAIGTDDISPIAKVLLNFYKRV